MRHLLLLILLSVSISLAGQKIFEKKLDGCSPKFNLENEKITLTYKIGDSLMIQDIVKGADDEQIYKLKGALAAQLIIDSAGNACLASYDTKFNTIRKPFDVVENFNTMPHWQGTGNRSFTSIIMRLYFERRQITVQRLGYDRNSGWNLLSTETFNKKEPEEKKK